MKPLFCSLTMFVLLVAFCLCSFASQFVPVTKYTIGQGAFGLDVVLGDFNGDGKLDVALTAVGQSLVYVLIGNGDGSFQKAKSYPGSPSLHAYGLAAGDFNKDGKLDLVVSDGGDVAAVSLLFGNGDGTFQAPVPCSAGPAPTTVAVGDFNNDGNLDIATASLSGGPANKGGVAVLVGNGDGTFQSSVLYSAGVAPNSVVVGNINGDTSLDIAAGTTGSIVAVLLGNGDGTFQKPIRNSIGVNPHYVGLGDFNGDGKLDVVATLENRNTDTNKVIIALGNGDGSLKTPLTITSPPRPQATAIADFNLDGALDLAIGASNSDGLDGLYLLLGKGNGNFSHGGNYQTGTSIPAATAVGDLNGDGHPDLVVLDGGTSVEVLLNTGTP